jgi:hypothetical protein
MLLLQRFIRIIDKYQYHNINHMSTYPLMSHDTGSYRVHYIPSLTFRLRHYICSTYTHTAVYNHNDSAHQCTHTHKSLLANQDYNVSYKINHKFVLIDCMFFVCLFVCSFVCLFVYLFIQSCLFYNK